MEGLRAMAKWREDRTRLPDLGQSKVVEQCRVPTAQGKWKEKNPCQGKHMEFENFAKTQGIWFAQVVNALILKVN